MRWLRCWTEDGRQEVPDLSRFKELDIASLAACAPVICGPAVDSSQLRLELVEFLVFCGVAFIFDLLEFGAENAHGEALLGSPEEPGFHWHTSWYQFVVLVEDLHSQGAGALTEPAALERHHDTVDHLCANQNVLI